MSYTFEVFPGWTAVPSAEALAARVTGLLRGFVVGFPVEKLAALSPALLAEARESVARGALTVEAVLDGTLEGTFGAARLTLRGSEYGEASLVRQVLAADAPPPPGAVEKGLGERFARAREVGYLFQVTRTIGQPALVALAHGYAAAALAEATDGFLTAPDGAWDPALLPCLPAELIDGFMRPERASAERWRRTAEDRLRELPEELPLFEAELVERVLDEIVGELVAAVNGVRGGAEAELSAFDRAIDRLETVRALAPAAERDLERAVLIGDAVFGRRKGRASALMRLRPSVDEYSRWMGHLGDALA